MRTFIAIELEKEVREVLSEAQEKIKKFCRRGNYTPESNFHLTLHFLGEIQEEDLEYLQDAMYEASLRNRPFMLRLDRIGFFPRGNKGILWMGLQKNPQLLRLFGSLEKSLERQGFARERKGLSPHITLGREVEPYRSFAEVQRAVRTEPAEISVKSISLMESVRKGPKLIYRPLFVQELRADNRRK